MTTTLAGAFIGNQKEAMVLAWPRAGLRSGANGREALSICHAL
jgi:hypothetical protein